MTEQERELDLLVADLEQESRLLRARNERLERELAALKDAVSKSMRSLEALAPDSAAVIRQLRSAVEAL